MGPAMGTSASDASATRRLELRAGRSGDDDLSDVDDDDGAGSSRPVARAVAIGATARRDADRRGFLARIVARVVAANEQGADVIPPRTHSRVSTGLGARSARSVETEHSETAFEISRFVTSPRGTQEHGRLPTKRRRRRLSAGEPLSHGRTYFFRETREPPPCDAMWNPFACCCGESEDARRAREEEELLQATRARRAAAEAAEDRQRAYDASAVGRAAQKSQQKMRQQASTAGDRRNDQVVADWNA